MLINLIHNSGDWLWEGHNHGRAKKEAAIKAQQHLKTAEMLACSPSPMKRNVLVQDDRVGGKFGFCDNEVVHLIHLFKFL